jgi:deoxycytidylate deaminase
MVEIIYPYLPENRKFKFVKEDNSYMLAAKEISSKSGCVLQATGAVLVKNNRIIGRGTNAGKRVDKCPRVEKGSKTGEDYYLCKEICLQEGHAEAQAIKNAQEDTKGADLYLYGHWWCCRDCWSKMIKADVKDVYLLENAYEKFNFRK